MTTLRLGEEREGMMTVAARRFTGARVVAGLVLAVLSLAAGSIGNAAGREPTAGVRPGAALAPGGAALERIAAVINDVPITTADLAARTRLGLAASGLQDTPDNRQRLTRQVLHALIDEALQLQEAQRLNIAVSDRDVDAAFATLSRQNGMTPEQFKGVLAGRGVPLGTLRQQIKSQVGWSKVVQRKLRPAVRVSDAEIDAALARIRGNAGRPEYQVAEIFLAVDRAEEEEPVRRAAERLVGQLRSGADFAAVARQFSQAAGASSGGDRGWVQQGQLDDELDRGLRALRPGQVSEPIRSPSGFHILLLRNTRTVGGGGGNVAAAPAAPAVAPLAPAAPKPAAADPMSATVELRQLVLRVPAPEDRAKMGAQLQKLGGAVKGCPAFEQEIAKIGGNPKAGGEVAISKLPPDLGRLVASLPIGQLSPPLNAPDRMMVLMVCRRSAPTAPVLQSRPAAPHPAAAAAQAAPSVQGGGGLPSRESVLNAIGTERLEMLQRRLLRDLRRAANIELRAAELRG